MATPNELSDFQDAYGIVVRDARLRRGYSQVELGEKCGLDRTYISGIERGRRNPSLKTVLILARALRIRPHRILKLAEQGSGWTRA